MTARHEDLCSRLELAKPGRAGKNAAGLVNPEGAEAAAAIRRLAADNDRLRAALLRIATVEHRNMTPANRLAWIFKVANSALERLPHEAD